MTHEVHRDTKSGNVAKPVKRKWRSLPTLPRIRSDEQRAADDAALLASGDELRTLPELATELGVGNGALKALVWPLRTIRYLSTSHPVRYAAKDVREAVQPHLDRLRTRQAAHLAEEAAGRVRRAERAAAHAKVMASKAGPPKPPAPPSTKHTNPLPTPPRSSTPPARPTSPQRGAPEATIMRRRPA